MTGSLYQNAKMRTGITLFSLCLAVTQLAYHPFLKRKIFSWPEWYFFEAIGLFVRKFLIFKDFPGFLFMVC
ncbi:hypothetical protein AtDm6_1224 [Acetobacter tropicalis]|uniref:Uncharacterized protein n=1 Tax=Acetobacter tropicalis TaxID=104102 RepID=A0A094YUT9_9PROT|nr:hypothetical protein AtDm6_1224 [Acetobacter tropicalis]